MTINLIASDEWLESSIVIARKGEKASYRTIIIDAETWSADYPNCTFSIVYQRPDGTTYPAVITMSGTTITWGITEDDAAVEGTGAFELRLLSGDMVGKTARLYCSVLPSLSANGTPVTPEPDWVDTVIESAAQAIAAGEAAEEAQLLAEAARDIAQAAQGAAGGSASAAQGYAADAAGSAGDAQGSAETAANNLLNGVSTHNGDAASHADIRAEIDAAEAIARGRATSLAFDTETQLDAWIAGTYTREDGLTVADLQTGDNL